MCAVFDTPAVVAAPRSRWRTAHVTHSRLMFRLTTCLAGDVEWQRHQQQTQMQQTMCWNCAQFGWGGDPLFPAAHALMHCSCAVLCPVGMTLCVTSHWTTTAAPASTQPSATTKVTGTGQEEAGWCRHNLVAITAAAAAAAAEMETGCIGRGCVWVQKQTRPFAVQKVLHCNTLWSPWPAWRLCPDRLLCCAVCLQMGVCS